MKAKKFLVLIVVVVDVEYDEAVVVAYASTCADVVIESAAVDGFIVEDGVGAAGRYAPISVILTYCRCSVGQVDYGGSDGEYRVASPPSEPLMYRFVICRLHQDLLFARKANFFIDLLRAKQF